jgi:hexulose-6-phosphate isomerase
MTWQVDRRRFLRASGLALAGAATAGALVRTAPAEEKEAQPGIRKALGYTMIQGDLSVEDKLRMVKEIGFEGVETPTQQLKRDTPEPKVLARAAEKTGVRVHGVVNSSHADLKAAIDEAAIYGATSVLHVVRTDPDGSFMENYRATQKMLREAAPYAEKKRIYILIENVWATFLIEPLMTARYIDEIGSPYVKAYFDVGNVVRWGYPQHWIEVLADRIVKVHVKEFDLKVAMDQGMRHAFDFPLGEGSIQWDKVRQQLKAIGYHGWVTAEVKGGDRQRLADISAQMDRVLEL